VISWPFAGQAAPHWPRRRFEPAAFLANSSIPRASDRSISGECRLLSTGSYALVIDAPPGKVLQVDSSRDFQTWSTISSLTNAVSRVEVVDPSPQSAPYRFYRASRR
jgi:hypothetical protein